MSRVTTLIPPPVACAALSSPLARGRAGNGAPPSRPVQAESSGASTTKRPHRLTPAAGSLSAGLPRLFSLIAYVDIIPYFIAFLPIVKSRFSSLCQSKSQALNAHNFSLLVLSNFDKPTWPPSCPMVGSLRVFLFCSPCSAPLTSSPFDCPLCWFLPVTRSARSPAGTPGT